MQSVWVALTVYSLGAIIAFGVAAIIQGMLVAVRRAQRR